VRVCANAEGPQILFLIGLHPDEAGFVWEPLVSLITDELKTGSLTLIHCFPGVPLERRVGPGKQDPNRCFPPPADFDPTDILQSRLNLVRQHVDACDVLVDFHRYHKEDGGMVAFPFDENGIAFGLEIGIQRIVVDLVWMVEGAVALYAHRSGKKTLVIEAGPKSRRKETDRRVLRVASRILEKIDGSLEVAPAPWIADKDMISEWPQGAPVLRCIRAIARSEVSDAQVQNLANQDHLGPISEVLARHLNLDLSARLLLVNPESDPVAFACVPVEGFTPSSLAHA
jgi:hypothetical protein